VSLRCAADGSPASSCVTRCCGSTPSANGGTLITSQGDGESECGPSHRTSGTSNELTGHAEIPQMMVLFRVEQETPAARPSSPRSCSPAAPGFRPACSPRQPTPRGATRVSVGKSCGDSISLCPRQGTVGEYAALWALSIAAQLTCNRSPAPNLGNGPRSVAREAVQAFVAGRDAVVLYEGDAGS